MAESQTYHTCAPEFRAESPRMMSPTPNAQSGVPAATEVTQMSSADHNSNFEMFKLAAIAAAIGASLSSTAPAAETKTVKSVLAQADRNDNGKIEGEEWSGIPESIRGRLGEAARDRQFDFASVTRPDDIARAFRNRMVYVFDYYDQNDNGRLTPEESERLDGRHARMVAEMDLSRSITRNKFVDQYCRIAAGLSIEEPERERVTLDLPTAYVPLDTDEDGQIGYYEWPRRERFEFFFLDLNEDGFLTPRELPPDEEENGDSDDD